MQLTNKLFSFSLVLLFFISQISCAQKRVEQQTTTSGINFSTFNHKSEINSGYWFVSLENSTACIQLMDGKNRSHPSFNINFCIPQNQLTTNEGAEGFELVRESGTLLFTGGTLNTKEGGDFTFKRNDGFETFLKQEGIQTDDSDRYYYFKLFLGDVTRAYVSGVKAEGYAPTLRELGKLGIHQVRLEYIRALSATQYKGLELGMVYKFAIHDVSIAYLNDLKAAGYGDIDAGMVKKFAIHNVGIDYINGLSKLGYGNLEPNMLKNFAVHDISLKYIESLAAVGYGNLEPGMLKKFAVHRINADYIRSLKKTGIANPDANTIKKAKVHNLKASDIERAMANGNDSNSLSHYIRLKVHGK